MLLSSICMQMGGWMDIRNRSNGASESSSLVAANSLKPVESGCGGWWLDGGPPRWILFRSRTSICNSPAKSHSAEKRVSVDHADNCPFRFSSDLGSSQTLSERVKSGSWIGLELDLNWLDWNLLRSNSFSSLKLKHSHRRSHSTQDKFW